MTDLTKRPRPVKARGVPQHVIDKLDFPALPDGYEWKVDKPWHDDWQNCDYVRVRVRRASWPHREMLCHVEKWGLLAELVERYNTAARNAHDLFAREHSRDLEVEALWAKS